MVNWTSDKDQTILRGIFVFHDIKNSGPLLDYLAKEIGEGCTPKAVSHRLANLRNHGKIAKRKGSTTLIPVRAAASPRTPRTPTSGRSRTKDTSTKKPTDNDTASEGEEDAESIVSPSDGRKRARYSKTPASYAESDAVSDDEDEPFTPKNKRVKTEPAEDEDTTDTIKDVEYFKEEDDAVAFV